MASGARADGGRRGLTRDGIARAALQLIDDGGLQAFSMRRLGARLEVDATAVYWHFRNQEELFEAVAGRMVAEVDLEALPWEGPWAAFGTAYCTGLHDVLLAHPNAVVLFASRPVRSPDAVRAANHAVELMVRDGFTPGQAVRAAQALRAYVVGCALDVAATALVGLEPRRPSPRPPADNLLAQGVAEGGDYFAAGLAALVDGLRPGGRASLRP